MRDPKSGARNRKTPLMLAVCAGSLAAARRLLDADVDVNARDERGCTALHHAADRGSSEALIRLLFKRGADPNIGCLSGRTPLISAITLDRRGIVKLLLDHGAQPNRHTRRGESPLCFAVVWRRSRIAKMLLKRIELKGT